MAKISVIFDEKTEETRIEVDGVAGPACEDLTRRAEELTGSVIDRELTSEYYDTEKEMESEQDQDLSY